MNQPTLFKATLMLDQHSVKKNNRDIFYNKRTNKPFLGKSSKLKSAEMKMMGELKRTLMYSDYKLPIAQYINAQFIFWFPKEYFFTKKGNINRKIPDLSNLYQLPEDILETCRVIENDHLIASHDGSERKASLTDNFILEIILTAKDGYAQINT